MSMNHQQGQDHEGHSISVTSVIAASPARLYEAWLSASDLTHCMSARVEIDPVVGGHYRLTWSTDDGDISATGEYLHLEPGKTIVQTWTPVGPDGETSNGGVEIRIEFRDLGNGTTEMTQTESGPGFQTAEQIRESKEGTKIAHEALQHHIEMHAIG
jgi:uncharacterized protein YndB with AHSA1/START domain